MSGRPAHRPRSLVAQLTWWFAAALLALYGTTAGLGWLYARTTARQYTLLALKQEVEQAATYVAETGRLDLPEFDEAEDAPIPLYLRAVRDGRVVRSSPGTPGVDALRAGSGETVTTGTFRHGGVSYMVVHHRVGGNRGDLAIEALGSLAPLLERERRLGGALALIGLLLIPLAALGGRRAADRALAPLESLVRSIRALDPAARDARLDAPPRAVHEVEILTTAFNDLLARLQGTVESMRRFTADASHEIRNPLSVVRSGLEIALRRERTPEQYRTLVRENLQEIERLQSVLEGLLALTRGGPGAPVVRREATDFSAVVSRTAAAFETVAAERGVRLALAVEPGVVVDGDAALLRLIVFNLVDNALKHGPRGAPVEVALGRDGAAARLCVADHGAGVPDDVRARLFERFNRGGGAQAAGGVGGLGLSVVRWVAELHGGAVRLLPDGGADPAPAASTCFEVRLPLHADADADADADAGATLEAR